MSGDIGRDETGAELRRPEVERAPGATGRVETEENRGRLALSVRYSRRGRELSVADRVDESSRLPGPRVYVCAARLQRGLEGGATHRARVGGTTGPRSGAAGRGGGGRL